MESNVSEQNPSLSLWAQPYRSRVHALSCRLPGSMAQSCSCADAPCAHMLLLHGPCPRCKSMGT